jgi:hypothetical protein
MGFLSDLNIEPLDAMLWISVLGIAYSFIIAARRKDFRFNPFDLLMENGKLSKVSCAFMLAIGISTWVILKLLDQEKLTEGFYIAFLGTLVVPLLTKIIADANKSSEKKEVITSVVAENCTIENNPIIKDKPLDQNIVMPVEIKVNEPKN